jgi:hypothetical protein
LAEDLEARTELSIHCNKKMEENNGIILMTATENDDKDERALRSKVAAVKPLMQHISSYLFCKQAL